MGRIITITDESIREALQGVRRQYFAGNLKRPQKLDFIRTEALEIGITSYETYTAEDVHFHAAAAEYQYMLSGRTWYMDVDTGEIFEFSKGDFYVIMPGTVYAQKSKAGTSLVFIKVPSVDDKHVLDPSDTVRKWYAESQETERKGNHQEGGPLKISGGRVSHCLAVAETMKRLAKQYPKGLSADEDDLFLLGYLHDIGYAFADEQRNHACAGGEELKRQGYRYWREVYYHGKVQEEYDSAELDLLNYADMVTDVNGNDVTVSERIADIGRRYGESSYQKKESEELARKLSALPYYERE